MIGYLNGIIVALEEGVCLCEVAGVGYEVFVHGGLMHSLCKGQQVVFFIHHVVREDAQSLYGFLDATEKAVFRVLLQASGVGPKLALTMLGAFPQDSLVGVVQKKDVAALKSIKGVGARVAEKMVVELQPKFAKWYVASAIPLVSSAINAVVDEALQALMQLGYQQKSGVRQRVERIYQDGMSTEVLLRKALQELD